MKILLSEPADLLRRTVSLTVRSLGMVDVTEAATYPVARQLCELRRFDGAVIAFEADIPCDACTGLALVRQIRQGRSASPTSIPIVVLVDSCDARMLDILRPYGVHRVLIKPFRARDVIETITSLGKDICAAVP